MVYVSIDSCSEVYGYVNIMYLSIAHTHTHIQSCATVGQRMKLQLDTLQMSDQKPFQQWKPTPTMEYISPMPWHFSVHTWNLDALALGCSAPSGHMHLQSIYVHHSVGVCMTDTYTYAYILYVYYTHFSNLLPSLTMSLVWNRLQSDINFLIKTVCKQLTNTYLWIKTSCNWVFTVINSFLVLFALLGVKAASSGLTHNLLFLPLGAGVDEVLSTSWREGARRENTACRALAFTF